MSSDDHSFANGALRGINRMYDKLHLFGLIDFFYYYRIGTTHEAHYFYSVIPYCEAQIATDAIKTIFPTVRFGPNTTLIVNKGCTCTLAEKRGDKWV
jgi:hypothetical protein